MFKTKAAMALAVVLSTSCPAFADTLQGFICDQNGAVVFQSPTSKDKKYVIPSIGKIAALTDAQANGPVGIVYNLDRPQQFSFIQWYYKQSNGSEAVRGVTVRYCVQKADGTGQQSFDVPGGEADRGGGAGDGWRQYALDTRSSYVPDIVKSGQAYLTKLTFLFKDKKGAGNITLGRVNIQNGQIDVTNLITEIGPCNLKEKCVVEVAAP